MTSHSDINILVLLGQVKSVIVDAMQNGTPKRVWGDMETRGGRQVFRQRLLLSTFMDLVPAGRILDAGCGDGSLTVTLLANEYRVVAVDVSEPALERLLNKAKDGGRESRLEARVAGLDRIDEPDSSIDGIVCGEVLEHLEDDEAAVSEFFRLLKPGGFCVVTVPADPGKWSFVDEWAGHFRRYTLDGLAGMFEKAGFQTKEIHHWGWPALTLYDRIVYRAWAKKGSRMSGPECEELAGTKIAQSPLVSKLMASVFSIDRLFFRLPLGIGLIGSFQKPVKAGP